MRTHAVFQPLRRRADFSRVHAQGRRAGDARIQVRVLRRPGQSGEPPLRIGIVVSKKFGSAVARNRFKRIVRAALRAIGLDCTPGWDLLILPRAARQATTPEIEASLRQLLTELHVLSPLPEHEVGGETESQPNHNNRS